MDSTPHRYIYFSLTTHLMNLLAITRITFSEFVDITNSTIQTGYIFGAVAILTAAVNMGIAVMADKAKSLLTSTQMRKALCGSLSIVVVMCFILMMKLECDTHTIIFCIAILVMFSSSVSSKYFEKHSK